jgi:hypothetical protein
LASRQDSVLDATPALLLMYGASTGAFGDVGACGACGGKIFKFNVSRRKGLNVVFSLFFQKMARRWRYFPSANLNVNLFLLISMFVKVVQVNFH